MNRKNILRKKLNILINDEYWYKDLTTFLKVREIIAELEERKVWHEKDMRDFKILNNIWFEDNKSENEIARK